MNSIENMINTLREKQAESKQQVINHAQLCKTYADQIKALEKVVGLFESEVKIKVLKPTYVRSSIRDIVHEYAQNHNNRVHINALAHQLVDEGRYRNMNIATTSIINQINHNDYSKVSPGVYELNV